MARLAEFICCLHLAVLPDGPIESMNRLAEIVGRARCAVLLVLKRVPRRQPACPRSEIGDESFEHPPSGRKLALNQYLLIQGFNIFNIFSIFIFFQYLQFLQFLWLALPESAPGSSRQSTPSQIDRPGRMERFASPSFAKPGFRPFAFSSTRSWSSCE